MPHYLLSPAQDGDTHVRSVEFVCHSRARVWRARGIPNSAGGRGEGPGFFARQPRARMTEQEIEQDRNCNYELQNSNSVICGCCPHPRVTAVAKKTQPPRRVPSPWTGRGIWDLEMDAC